MSSLKALTSVMLRLNVEGLVMNDVTQLILMYFIIPLWFIAGIVDWFCHRSSNIAATAGPKESLIHLLMFLEVGVPLFLVLLFEVNSLIIAVGIVFFLLHELTALWDVSYAVSKRRVGPIEQHVHSFLEMIPLLALILVIARHWSHFIALFGLGESPADFGLRFKQEPLPTWYLLSVIAVATVLEFLPYVEELIRGMKAKEKSSREKATLSSDKENQRNREADVSHQDAEAASPYASSVAGEEDPGVALEEWVESNKK